MELFFCCANCSTFQNTLASDVEPLSTNQTHFATLNKTHRFSSFRVDFLKASLTFLFADFRYKVTLIQSSSPR